MRSLINRIKEMVPLSIRMRKHVNEYFSKYNFASIQKVFENQEKNGLKNIPVFLISFNRLSYLESMIKRLEQMNVKNIHIIDNASTYPPLLEYYKSIPYEVFYMKSNEGQMVFWKNSIFDEQKIKLIEQKLKLMLILKTFSKIWMIVSEEINSIFLVKII